MCVCLGGGVDSVPQSGLPVMDHPQSKGANASLGEGGGLGTPDQLEEMSPPAL